MTTKAKLKLLLKANKDFSNVEIINANKPSEPIEQLERWHAFTILLNEKYELRIKEQL